MLRISIWIGILAVALSFRIGLLGQNVIAWGDNTFGQCDVPPAATNVIGLAAGSAFSIALTSDHSIIAGGAAAETPADLNDVISIPAGVAHCLALKTDGTVRAWGTNDSGQLTIPAEATNIIDIAAGYGHNLALKADHSVVAWGNNEYGQCQIPGNLSNVVAIAAGLAQSIALQQDGSVIVWGGISTNKQLRFSAGPYANRRKDTLWICAGATHNAAIKP